MSAFYDGLRATAGGLLSEYGMPMVLRKRTPGGYDPTTGGVTLGSIDIPCTGAAFDYPAIAIDGTSIQRGDKKVLLSAEGLDETPDTGDQIVTAEVARNVISVKAIAPAGTVVMFELQVRS